MPIIPLRAGDRIQLKKEHPCGGKIFSVIRVGSEVRGKCETCARDMTLDRIKLEKAIKQHFPAHADPQKSEVTE